MIKNVGLQLYTVREYLDQDFIGTLKKVAAIGYRSVEFAGYGGLSAAELRNVVTDLGLAPVSSHLSMDLLSQTEETIDYALELGLSYVVCPWLPKADRKSIDDYRRVGEKLAGLGAIYAEHGLTLCYHNHDFEFQLQRDDGLSGFDTLYESAPAHTLQAEFDVYWMERSNLKAVDYLLRYADRCPLVHIKDMSKDPDRAFAEVGSGILPIAEIIDVADRCGTKWFFVEQDVCKGDPLQSVKTSFNYLHQIGII